MTFTATAEPETEIESELPDVSAPPEAQDSPEGSDPNHAPAAATGQPQQPSPWDAFKRLREFQGADDRTIVGKIYAALEREKASTRALQQYQQFMPVVQEYLPHRGEFQKWLQERSNPSHQSQPQAQQQVTSAPKPWEAPKVRESFKRFLVKDPETGREVVSPDAPLDAQHELFEYQKHKAEFAQKFLENPEAAIGPLVQELAAKQAQEIVQQRFEQTDNENFVNSVEAENRDWMTDEQGNPTPAGLLAHQYAEEARGLGIMGPRQRWDYAVKMTERDMMIRMREFDAAQQFSPQSQPSAPFPQEASFPGQSAPPPAPSQAERNMQWQRQEAARSPSRSAGTAAADSRMHKPPRSFAQMLAEEVSSRGLA